jgi:Domain of unknown function (DUF5753)
MAARLGISQKHVSRLELGTADTSRPQVIEWARAAGMSATARKNALQLTIAAVDESQQLLRDKVAGGAASIQEAVGRRESVSKVIRNFQLGFVPGLLQTADYARAVFTLADLGSGDQDAAVLARLQRQQALHETGRRFEFIMTEAALRWRPGTKALLAEQLQHITSVASLDTVSLRVIPASAQMRAIPRCAFVVHEDYDRHGPAVFVETPHQEARVTDPADVAIYVSELDRFRRSSLDPAASITFVRDLAATVAT